MALGHLVPHGHGRSLVGAGQNVGVGGPNPAGRHGLDRADHSFARLAPVDHPCRAGSQEGVDVGGRFVVQDQDRRGLGGGRDVRKIIRQREGVRVDQYGIGEPGRLLVERRSHCDDLYALGPA